MADIKNDTIGMTDIEGFDFNGFLTAIDEFNRADKALKELREVLEQKCRDLGNKSLKDDDFPIQFIYSSATTRVGIDNKAIQKNDPALWETLHNTYGKDSAVKDSYKLDDKRKERKHSA